MSKKVGLLYVGILVLLVGGGTYWHLQDVEKKRIEEPLAKETKCQYKNVNPLRCEPDLAVKKKEFVVLRNELNDYIETKEKERKVSMVSVYFRDLQNGPILNIHEQENFAPASLLKLPLLVMYYKKAESDSVLLLQKIKVEGQSTYTQNITPGESAKVGNSYTIEDLIRLLITESDNNSWKTLLAYMRANYSEQDFIDTLSDLGIIDPRKRDSDQYITVQGYASLFRILYNSSYLDVNMSDKALTLLQKTTFDEGIVAGIPENIKVAHKFGERIDDKEKQLHDCGIVYYPNNPYIICVMTRGDSIEELKPIIKEISKMVYDEVDYRNKN